MNTAQANSKPKRSAILFLLALLILTFFSAVPASAAGTVTVTEVHEYPGAVETRTPRGVMTGTVNLLDRQHPEYDNVAYELESIAVEKMALYYTVFFAANGGSPTPSAQTVGHGEKVTEPYDPERSGYTFAGWYPTADFSGSAWDFANDTIIGDMTLYAKWTANVNYVVVFVANGGVPVPPFQTLPSGQKVTLPADPSRSGYEFGGWYTTWDFSGPAWDFDTETITGNTILYARWTLEIDAGLGEVEDATPVSLPKAPSLLNATTVWTTGQPNSAADYTFEEGHEYRITYYYKAATPGGGGGGGNGGGGGTRNPDTYYDSYDTTIDDQPVPLDQLPDLITIPDNNIPLTGSLQTGAHRSRIGIFSAILLLCGLVAGWPARKNNK